MEEKNAYTIKFVGLKEGKHQFDYQIKDEFFDFFEYDDFNTADVKVNIELNKKANMLEFIFDVIGIMNLDCDVSTEAYDQKIQNRLDLVVKFGEEYNDDHEDVLILPWSEYEIDVKQYIYEAIVLAIPQKRVHPGVEDGTLDSEILDRLEDYQPEAENDNKDEEEIDPRWEDLKKLLNE
ncbi:MAG: YceD family protein [Psychroflexus halocasei]